MKLNNDKLNQLLDMFEHHEPTPEANRKAWERSKPWDSFKLEAITKHSPEYETLSDLVRDCEASEDYAYTWTIEALEAIQENASYHDSREDLEESLRESADAITPVYNHDLMEWLHSGSNYCLVDESIEELGKGDSLMSDIMAAYCMAWERHAIATLEAVWEMIGGDNE